MKRPRAPGVVRVQIPDSQPPFIHLPGSGWYVSVLWNHGHPLDVTRDYLRALLSGSSGDVLVARRLKGRELKFFESYRENSDAESHARMIFKDPMRWRPPRKR